jgi:transcriptional regulator with XRE-family HTH domain
MPSQPDRSRLYEEVGRSIRQERLKRKITQEDLGMRVGLTRTSITNIERGRQKLLLHTLVAIADALAVGLTSLLPVSSGTPPQNLDKLLKDKPDAEREFVLAGLRSAQTTGSPK